MNKVLNFLFYEESDEEESKGYDPYSYEECYKSAQFILSRTKYRPKIAIICGVGLNKFVTTVQDPDSIPFESIPNFGDTRTGNDSRLIVGTIFKTPVLIMQDQYHYYEGYTMKKCTMPVRVMRICGIEMLITLDQAGSVNDEFNLGDIMIITDHINIMGMAGVNPLRGINDERFGPRFVPTCSIYDSRWVETSKHVASGLNMGSSLQEGSYSYISGPSYETPSEMTFLKLIGADAIGMSVVHENITAYHCGMTVFSCVLITHKCASSADVKQLTSYEKIRDVTRWKINDLSEFICRLVYEFNSVLKESEDSE